MSNTINHLLLFLIMLLFSIAGSTQSTQLPGFKHFPLEKDNKPVRVNLLFRDHKGYLFAGTNDGLYKFDGEKYSKIPFETENHMDTVSAIFQDSDEKIWVGFKSGHLANLVNKKLLFLNPEEGLPKKKITAFLEDKEQNIWFSTAGEGIYFFRNGRMYLINADNGLTDTNISSLALNENGDVMAGSDQGIQICDTRNGKKYVRVINPRHGLPDYIVTTIVPAAKAGSWIGLHDKGFCLLSNDEKTITIPGISKKWQYGQVNSMLEVNHTLWIATHDSGLFAYNIPSGTIDKVSQELVRGNTSSLVNDNQGNIWLSSQVYGTVRTPGSLLTLTKIPGSPVFEHVHVLLCDKNGNVWLNDEGNDLIKINMSTKPPAARKIHLPGLTERTDITALYQDINGNIWVGTMGKGIFIIDTGTLRHRAFEENPSFINSSVLSINGKDQTLFVSSLQGCTQISVPENKPGINNLYQYANFDNKSIGTNYVYDIFKDSKGRIWFGTDGTGLILMEQGHFTSYDKRFIKDERIYSVTEDKKANIWFSTASAGIYKFDGSNFINYTQADGLTDLNISVLKTDRNGNIIIVHKKGLDILDPETGNVHYLASNHRIPVVNAEDLGAVTNDTSGNIMVNTPAGILTCSFPRNTIEQPVALIESVQLFLKDLDSLHHNFSHDENNFTFNYTGLYYSTPDRVYYKYKLEGLDSNWIITQDRSKNFPRLAPGKYKFRIQAALNRNFKNASEASYAFVIRQAFYKTSWFIVACVAVALLLIYWYIKNREAGLKRIERLRQEKIQFRFEVLRNQVNPHFLFNSFNTLISTIEEEPKMAVEYAGQLSDFFRNIVNQRDKDVISLKDEIDALQSYTFLQQKRYGAHLDIQVHLSEDQKTNNNIPPLTLQLLVENAIKHNAVSKESPLLITLELSDDNYLAVKNNINPRINNNEGTGMGLQNIINRYNLLTSRQIKIFNNGKHFIVSLPLLK